MSEVSLLPDDGVVVWDGKDADVETCQTFLNSIEMPETVIELYLQRNFLQEMPDLSRFPRLGQLFVWSNKLSCFGPNLSFCSANLTHLDLDDNRIERIPRYAMRNCVNLQILYLSKNFLTQVPSCIADFKHLTRLYLSNNPLPDVLCSNAASQKTVNALQIQIRSLFKARDLCRESCYELIALRAFRRDQLGALSQIHLNTFVEIAKYLFSTRFESCWDGIG